MPRAKGYTELEQKIVARDKRQRDRDANIIYTLYGLAYDGLRELRAAKSKLTDEQLIRHALRLYAYLKKKKDAGYELRLHKAGNGRSVRLDWEALGRD